MLNVVIFLLYAALAYGLSRVWGITGVVLGLAVAYSVLANANHRVRPHLGAAAENSGGQLLQRIEPGAAQHVTIDPRGNAMGFALFGQEDRTLYDEEHFHDTMVTALGGVIAGLLYKTVFEERELPRKR